jgi:hypothetical protein
MDASPTPGATPGEPAVNWTKPQPGEQGPPRKHSRLQRLTVGSGVTFVVASLLYGPQNVLTALAFATICTLGIGLVAILLCCWLIGWVVLELWDAVPAMWPRAT